MDWAAVYEDIDEILTHGTITGAAFDYYRTLYIEFYDYKRGFINRVRFNRGGAFHYWQ